MVSNQEPIMTYNVILSDPDVIDVKEVVMVSNVNSLGLGTFVFYNFAGEVACIQLCEETLTCVWLDYLEEQQYCLIRPDCNSHTTSTSSCLEG